MVIDTSPVPAATTVEVTLAVLFAVYGSLVLEPTVGVAVIVVPADVPAFTFNVIGMLTEAPEASEEPLQLMAPVPPTAGVMHVQPAGGVMAWKVVFGGVVKLYVGVAAVVGPLFVIVC